MKTTKMFALAVLGLTLTAGPVLAQQLELPRPSPKAMVMQQVGLTEVTIAYGRPAVRGREVWGSLVPLGQVWRTGANEATTITFSTEVTVAGTVLPAGTYGLFTIPGKNEWTVILNKGATQWGAYQYTSGDDVVRFSVKPQSAEFAEMMTFSIADVSNDGAVVHLHWERVQVSFPFAVDTIPGVLANARAAVAGAAADDWRTPLRAAAFCVDNAVNLKEADTWVERSLSVREGFYNLLVKARLLALQGDKTAAVATVRRAIEVGKAAQPPADTAPAELLLADLQK
jgi:hypothetical protein